jgi:hypothetical protein
LRSIEQRTKKDKRREGQKGRKGTKGPGQKGRGKLSHRLRTIRDCKKIVVLERGGLVEEGGHAELMATPTLSAASPPSNNKPKAGP